MIQITDIPTISFADHCFGTIEHFSIKNDCMDYPGFIGLAELRVHTDVDLTIKTTASKMELLRVIIRLLNGNDLPFCVVGSNRKITIIAKRVTPSFFEAPVQEVFDLNFINCEITVEKT